MGRLLAQQGFKANPVAEKKAIKRPIFIISGVAMLFIEMILFVIRTHEMDRAMRQKQAKQSKLRESGVRGRGSGGAFGYYTANTAREFKED